MTTPAAAWACSLRALGLGAGLGCLFGFLRPLARRRAWLADLLFLPALLGAWIYHSFAVCLGDPRLGYLPAAFLGAVCWERTLGRVLRPLWEHIWAEIGGFWRTISRVRKKIFTFMKKLFAYLGKWGTINWNNRRHFRRMSGGDHHREI